MKRICLILAILFGGSARAETIDAVELPRRTVWNGHYWTHYQPRYYLVKRTWERHDWDRGVVTWVEIITVEPCTQWEYEAVERGEPERDEGEEEPG